MVALEATQKASRSVTRRMVAGQSKLPAIKDRKSSPTKQDKKAKLKFNKGAVKCDGCDVKAKDLTTDYLMISPSNIFLYTQIPSSKLRHSSLVISNMSTQMLKLNIVEVESFCSET